MELGYNQQRPIQSLTYREQRPQQMEIAYNKPRPTPYLRYNEQRPQQIEIAYNEPRPIPSLTYNEQRPQQMEMDFTQQRHIQPMNYNQQILIAQENMQIYDMETYKSQPVTQAVYTSEIVKYNPNTGKLRK